MRAPRALFLAAALLLGACTRPLAPPVATPPLQDAAPGPLISTLSVETVGDSVRLQLSVTNASAAPVEITFPSGQTYDFAVRRGDELLWQWSQAMRFIQQVRTVTFAPGETRTYAEAWTAGAGTRGELSAQGWLASSSHRVERTAAFRLP